LSIISTVATALQTDLGPELDAIGRDNGVIRRQRKFSGATQFPGCGGSAGFGKAAVKIQARWELIRGQLTKLVVEPGRTSDGQNEEAEDPVKPGSLIIRDLGYFALDWFAKLGQAGAYWISRWQQGTMVCDPDGRPLDLLKLAREHRGKDCRPTDLAGGDGAAVVPADPAPGAPGDGRPSPPGGVREGPQTRPPAQRRVPGVVRVDGLCHQRPGGEVELEGGGGAVPGPLAN
jgi:hypothetical protein